MCELNLRGTRTRLIPECLSRLLPTRVILVLIALGIGLAPQPVLAQCTTLSCVTIDDPNAGPGGTFVKGISDLGSVIATSRVGTNGGYRGYLRPRKGPSSYIACNPVTNAADATNAVGINSLDEVVGDCNGPLLGFFWFSGALAEISFPGTGGISGAVAISNSGTILGLNTNGTAGPASLLQGNQVTPVSLPPGCGGLEPATVSRSLNTNGNFTAVCNATQNAYVLGGQTTTIAYPGAGHTGPAAINDAGVVVGYFTGSTGQHCFKFNAGQYTQFDPPGASSSNCTWINNAGDIVGYYSNSAGTHGFLLSRTGTLTIIDFQGATATFPVAVNNTGLVAGNYTDASGLNHGFLASITRLLDPVPNALNGPNVVSDTAPPNANGWSGADLLSFFGRQVQGVAADGVSQVAIAIPATNVGDQFTVSLFNDQSPPSPGSSNEDGALGKPGDTTLSANQVTVTARATTFDGPTAFAEYRAPVDFARPIGSASGGVFRADSCNGTANTDNNSACRYVTVVVQNLQTNTNYSLTIQIVRPPVLLVHGLWSNPQAWSNFLVTSNGSDDPRFYRRTIDWSGPLAGGDQITATAPSHGSIQMGRIKGNSVGIEFNSPRVQQQISAYLSEFKSGTNPISAPVAAVQSDIVGHSMGGDLTLGMRLSSPAAGYQRNDNLGQGDVHKLITVDTPYLGSPLATQLLQGYLGTGPSNDCVRGFLDLAGSFSLASVSFAAGPNRPGAIYDLQGDGLGSGMSFALEGVTDPILSGPLHIPTAIIAAYMTSANLAPIDTAPLAGIVHKFCGTVAINPNPIALNLTSSGWPNVFNGAASDAIVPFTSEVNAKNGNISANILSGSVFQGLHGGGLNLLGFAPPTVLDAGTVPSQVVTLLNYPVTDPSAYNIF